jgi:hypothetical protein
LVRRKLDFYTKLIYKINFFFIIETEKKEEAKKLEEEKKETEKEVDSTEKKA